MFTDLVGSTELSERIGHEMANEVRKRHFAALRDSLAVHRGSQIKTLGDGIMAAFDSVSDGLACAVTMQRAVTYCNRREPGHSIAMRVGVSAGETNVVDDDYFGAPVIEASRLCDAAGAGEICVSDIAKTLAGATGLHRFEPVGALELKGISSPVMAWRIDWDAGEDFALRVVLADDSVLLREGVASVLRSAGIDVVLQAADAETVLRSLTALRPHVVVLDVRMPPTYTTEGLQAAERIRAEHPDVGVLVLSAWVDPAAARRLLAQATDGVGYLLKDRVGDIDQLTAAIRAVASGGSAIDAEVVARLEAPAGLGT
jgi:CheY-like chemotaxis protein